MDIENITQKVKDGAATFIDETEKVTKSVVQKSSALIEQTKLKFAMNEIENKMKNEYVEIGKYVYKQHNDGVAFEGFAGERCDALDKLAAELDDLKRQFAEAKNSVICEECGTINSDTSKFCSSCGGKL